MIAKAISILLLISLPAFGQTTDELVNKLTLTSSVPVDLLATRSVVLPSLSYEEDLLKTVQKAFQQIGIDAVAYYKSDVLLSGNDVSPAFAKLFQNRDIRYLIFLTRQSKDFVVTITAFNLKPDFVDAGQLAWQIKNSDLNELLMDIFRATANSQRKQNFLINDFPEPGSIPNIIEGRRSEFYAFDLKLDKLAVPKFRNEGMNRELEIFFKENYPFEYGLTEPGVASADLRKQGYLYVLCYVHSRESVAREILDYATSPNESAIASATYPNGLLQLKTIPLETGVYKFYFRHIDTGNIFLGPKWDADTTWQEALRNHILGFKTELK